jgi:hypothetical protein
MSAAPCSTEPVIEDSDNTEIIREALALVDGLERFVGNIRVLSADARAHLDAKFDRLRVLIPKC